MVPPVSPRVHDASAVKSTATRLRYYSTMTTSMFHSAALTLVLCFSVAESFVVAPAGPAFVPSSAVACRQHTSYSDRALHVPRSHPICTRAAPTRTSATVTMMGGFGAKKKETPPTIGAGKGQHAYVRQMRNFNGLKEAGAESVDVYVNRKGEDKFIFAGKAAWSSGISVEQALQWQRDLILDHVKLLEPSWREKKPSAAMRIFTAPPNSEVEVARNIHDLTWALGGKGTVDTKGMRSEEVGLKPELYDDEEEYFYVKKLEDGKCPAPPAEVMIESMDKVMAVAAEKAAASGVAPPPAAE